MSAAQDTGLPYEIVCDTDDEQEWLSFRDTGIGASEIGGVLALPGIGHRLSPLKLYCQKVGLLQPDDLSDVEAVEWGHTMEPVIAAKYSERTGRPAVRGRKGRFQVLRSKAHPWALCSLDFWTQDAANAPLHPLEVKNVSAFMAEDWVDGTPDYYYAQVQQQILVTGSHKGTSAACLGGNRLLWCDVNRDEQMIRQIIARGTELWARIKSRSAPDPDGSEATRETLNKVFSHDDGSTVVLSAAVGDVIYDWRDVKRQIKELEAREKFLANEIKATLGHATQGALHTGDRVSWKTQNVKEHVVKAGTKRPLLFHPAK